MRFRARVFYLTGSLGWIMAGCLMSKPAAIPLLPMDSSQQSILKTGIAVYEEEKYPQAIKIFQDLILHFPGSSVLVEAQWMLSRSYEQEGHWKLALLEYESFLSNFPQNHHEAEARVRIELLRELLQRETEKKAYPVIRGFEIADLPFPRGKLKPYGAEGFNALVLDTDVLGGASSSKVASEFVSMAHQEGFYVLARERVRPLNLFEPAAQTTLKQRLIEIAVSEMDGVLFDDLVSLPEEGLAQETVEQFKHDFGVDLAPEEILKSPSLYWRWVGWRSRELMKILKETVRPVSKSRTPFYWGIVFPSEVITVPHQAMAQTGLDLLEAKQQGLDYFGVRGTEDKRTEALLAKTQDLIGNTARVVLVIEVLDPETLRKLLPSPSGYGILYLKTRPSSTTALTKNPR